MLLISMFNKGVFTCFRKMYVNIFITCTSFFLTQRFPVYFFFHLCIYSLFPIVKAYSKNFRNKHEVHVHLGERKG